MQRYFVELDSNKNIIFTEQDVFHITKVMRFKVNDQVEVVIDGVVSIVNIDNLKPLQVHILTTNLNDSELEKEVTIFLPLLKSDKSELIIQKATELGVKNLVFYQSIRSIIKLTNDDFKKKVARYFMIAKEASEQCHRNVIPTINGIIKIEDIKSYMLETNLIAYEALAGKSTSFNDALSSKTSVSIILGPEGGFDTKEVDKLVALGFTPVSLGKRILRVETASIFALSVIANNLEK